MSILTRPPRQKRRSAFTLIEVALAIGVVAFALVATLGVFPAGLSEARKGVSDTRAAQLARMIVATIDSQASSFSSINCFGATLDLTNSSTTTAPALLYAEYPSPNEPLITKTQDASSIYTIEIHFNSVPPLAPGVTLPGGAVNQLQIRVRGLVTTSTDFREFMYLARKKP
jgi:uncharacterized protein (TIGR02598 family)